MHYQDTAFEALTLEAVKKVLAECYPNCEKVAEFTHGTLFIQDIEPRGARKVADLLKKISGTEPLISILKPTEVEPWPEYAFDI